ncbi:MAG TPA: hypothetical protein DEA44_12295 [Firmicutes bacterium]|nr:hypothetical protein [Bacillota bacterium]
MNMPASFHALSRREKTLLGVLGSVVVIAVCVAVFPRLTTTKRTDLPVDSPPQTVQAPAPVTVVRRELPAGSVKNPFVVPPRYRAFKESVVPGQGGGNSPGPTTAKPAGRVPVLSGIVVAGTARMAILELDGESETLGVGGSFKGYRVVSIADTQVELDGPAGFKVLEIGR